MLNFFGGRKAPVFLFLIAASLRFVPLPAVFSHEGLIYHAIVPLYWWRIFNGVLSSLHLIEFYFLKPKYWWLLCLNPVSILLVNSHGDAFWIFESLILTILLGKRFPKLALLTGLFTVALVFS